MSLYKLDSAMPTSAGGDTNLLVIVLHAALNYAVKAPNIPEICLYPNQTKSSVIHSIRKKEVGIIHCTIGMLIGNHLYPFLAKAQQILRKHTRYQKMHYIG